MKKFERLGPFNSYVVLVILYFLLVLLLPANKAAMSSYHLTSSTYHILLFIVELPLIATWLMAFFGYFKLNQYSAAIAETPEGDGFRLVTTGFLWLAWSMVLPSTLSLITGSIANSHPGFHPASIVIGNYASLILPLIAFTYMANGSERLLGTSKANRSVVRNIKPLFLLYAALAAVYCYLTFRYVDLQSPHSADNLFYLPGWLLVSTIVIPYLYAWFVGLLAAYEINTLARHVKGVLYRQGLNLIAGGVTLVIASSIGAQYLRSIVPRTGHLSLNSVLMIVYIFYIFIMLGFVLIVFGANRLKKIEDI